MIASLLALTLLFTLGDTVSALEVSEEAGPAGDVTEGERLFALHVQPLFREKCFGCHSDDADELEGGFSLQTRDAMLDGGDAYQDAVVELGESESSYLIAMIARDETGFEMPPKEADRLTDTQVDMIRRWIDAGAPWPDARRVSQIYADQAEGVTMPSSGGLSAQWTSRKYKPEDVWSFQPIRDDFPRLRQAGFEDESNTAWSVTVSARSPIDAFIDAANEELQLQAAPKADRRALIRRATFDLLGLPPTPEQVQEFVDDPDDDASAFATLVDRLLESEHYGEKWARHWLDVARYSDSSGFANDWERPNAWRYRDYVVRAFNDDKPYDEFTREQLAGDEIADLLRKNNELTPEKEAELLVATGFLRMGPWEHTAMSVAKVTRQQFLDDVTDSVGQVFLAQPLQCCRCHDHKFDPIPTRDYYSVQAVFATTQFADRDTEWLERENRSLMKSDFAYHERKRLKNQRVLQKMQTQMKAREAAWFQEHGLDFQSVKDAKAAGVDESDLPKDPLGTPEEFGIERIANKWRARFQWELDRYKPIAYSVYNGKYRSPGSVKSRFEMPANPMGKGVISKTHILTGGDPFADGDPVEPGVLSAMAGVLGSGDDETAGTGGVRIPSSVQGRRLALANWIVGDDNTLASRVMANRIWSHHFGRGIAGNPNNFGATGKKPTHPELLDWLAVQFRAGGWSVKNLHRLIMNTEAYQRSGVHPDQTQLDKKDPDRKSYAVHVPRRMAAEEIRDSMLFVSGELNPALGGIPIRPDMNLEAALQPRFIMGSFAPSYVSHPKPGQRNRRSIYVHQLRGHRLPFMETFNQPGSEISCELRDQSNVTPQVFTLFNSEESYDRAISLARRVIESKDVMSRLFQLVYQREPTPQEAEWALAHWEKMTERHRVISHPRQVRPVEVVREAFDENTGKPFQFVERLFAHEDYQPDWLPEQMDARTFGLADVCLAMLNSNEFVYID
ncbi:MAG: PSD1 and planctomycete cytochrome C domain-containing protein [Planctomycetota bacterium]